MSGPHSPSIGAMTHQGQVRELNEDSIGTPKLRGIPPDRLAARGWLLAVADGMGGHAAGEVASSLAIETLYEQYYGNPSPDLVASLEQAVEQANARIHAEAAADLRKHGMGTTLVAAVLHGSRLIVANVGDSRAYLVRGGHIRQISRDHSWVAESVAAGLITEEQARHHAQRHLVMRVLGQKPDVQVDVFEQTLRRGETVILCSDGLSNEVSDAEISQFAGHRPPREGAKMLLDLANARPARDNISVVVARLPAEQRRRTVSPLVALVVGTLLVLAVLAALAVLILRPWRGSPAPMVEPQLATHAPSPTFLLPPTPTAGAWTAEALTPAATVDVPSATPAELSVMPSPWPSPTASPSPAPAATIPAPPSFAAPAVERGLGLSETAVLLPLSWRCRDGADCLSTADALVELREILGSAADHCDLMGADPADPFDYGLQAQCPLPDETLVCLQGTVPDGWTPEMALRYGIPFVLQTAEGETWQVAPGASHRGGPPRLFARQAELVAKVTACGISPDGRLLWAPLIGIGSQSGSNWLSWLVPGENYWLAGRGEVLADLPVPADAGSGSQEQVSASTFGTEPVLVYSQWVSLGPRHRSGFQPVPVNSIGPAIFIWYEPNQRFEHASERGE